MFMFMAMIDAGVHMEASRGVSPEQLVLQTIEGSVAFARYTQRHPAELRNMVHRRVEQPLMRFIN
jgi:pyrroline-5-carboxylate reductase